MKKTNDIQNENFIFIPDEIQYQFDSYIENVIIPLLEAGEDTPIVEPQYWDLLILLRYSGLRLQEVLHLIAEHVDKRKECLQYDSQEDCKPYLNYCLFKKSGTPFTKMSISHLEDSSGRNMVERAIIRQKNRVENLPATSDGSYYLFREVNSKSEIVTVSVMKVNCILKKISETIPLNTFDGAVYKLSPRQFRATTIKDMVKLHNI